LFGGTNVIAVHAFNTSRNSSDFSMDLELISDDQTNSANPTPGARNSVAPDIVKVPPQVESVAHFPNSPASGDAVTITARITDPDGMAEAVLFYQLVDPGSYIRRSDPTYATDWTSLLLRDDGSGGDAVAGDSVFTAILPENLQAHRRLVRYRVTATDALGNAVSVPYADDEQPNFAYYVNDGIPAWRGAFRPGQTPLVTYPPDLLDDLPTYTLIANGSDIINSQYNGSYNKQRFHGTFVYNGEVFDHIGFRNRGEGSIYVSGKNKWRFYFNRGRRLQAFDNDGNEYAETWKSFSGDACASPWAALHRGSAGIEEAASYHIFQLAGVPSPKTHYYHFRVVRGPDESPAAGQAINDPIGNADGQYAGDFWGLYLAVEPIRGNFLDERGLPEGNLYKIESNAGDKKEQAPGQPVDSSDWDTFRNMHVDANPSEAWWRANMDMDAYYTFQAINRLIGNVDLRGGFNHYFYHRSTDGRWVPIPWDLDMMFIAKSHWSTSISGNSYPGVIHAHKSVLQHPALALEYRNRCREIIDLLASDATPAGGQIGQLLASLAQIVSPPGQTVTWANADAAMWNLHPRTSGSDGSAAGQTNHRGNFFRTPFADTRIGGDWQRWLRSRGFTGSVDHADLLQYFVDYATNSWRGGAWQVNNGNQLGYGYQYLVSEAFDPAVPATPSLSYFGNPGFPKDGLQLIASDFEDPQGQQTFAAREWRLAEIGGANQYEIEALWTLTTTTPSANTLNLPTILAVPGRSYRARVRQQDTSGRWSHWSAPLEFTAGESTANLVHYWNFNDPSELERSTFGSGSAIVYEVAPSTMITTGEGQDFSGANAANGDPAATHLRINNPLGSRMTFLLPSKNYRDLVARVETRRSGQGAGLQFWSYTTDGTSYLPLESITVPDGIPMIVELDFRTIPDTWNNPKFAVRVEWNQGEGGFAGNNRFDNFTLSGNITDDANFPPLPQSPPTLVNLVEGKDTATFDATSWFIDPEGDPLTIGIDSVRPHIASAATGPDGIVKMIALQRGESRMIVSAADGSNPPVTAEFRVLVHPAAHVLADDEFRFDAWDPATSEMTYPAHMLFLQSARNDPGINDTLDYTYHIPHDDYAEADLSSIGFPYRTSSRTRINGLGEDGISFINTGRGRDLGGALVALDTRSVENPEITWTAGTLVANSRSYALRLQYRIGTDGPFHDVLDDSGKPVMYHRSDVSGTTTDMPAVRLPNDALEQPYVQLLWKYHHVSGDSGPRDQLRLDNLVVSGSTTAPAPGTYAYWAASRFDDPGPAGPELDPDGDGRPNFLEFALARSPLIQDEALHELAITSGPRAAIRFERPETISGVTYELLRSDDLITWESVPDAVFALESTTDGVSTFTATDPSPLSSSRFLRLRITLGSPP
jgi:hypothetical protein